MNLIKKHTFFLIKFFILLLLFFSNFNSVFAKYSYTYSFTPFLIDIDINNPTFTISNIPTPIDINNTKNTNKNTVNNLILDKNIFTIKLEIIENNIKENNFTLDNIYSNLFVNSNEISLDYEIIYFKQETSNIYNISFYITNNTFSFPIQILIPENIITDKNNNSNNLFIHNIELFENTNTFNFMQNTMPNIVPSTFYSHQLFPQLFQRQSL